MAHPYHHALSSVKRWKGKVEDYLPFGTGHSGTTRKAFPLREDFRHDHYQFGRRCGAGAMDRRATCRGRPEQDSDRSGVAPMSQARTLDAQTRQS